MPSSSLISGAIELHAHASPSIFPRRQTDSELIADIKKSGMGGIVLKSHESQTIDRARILREQNPELHIYGGLVCNYLTGGLSPAAVDVAIRLGAKIIWMPTISSRQHREHFTNSSGKLFSTERPLLQPETGLSILDDKARLLPEVEQILEIIAAADVVLATGHLSPKEVDIITTAAFKTGVKKVLIQHPDMSIAPLGFEQQRRLAAQGAILEKCYLACSDDFKDLSLRQMADNIRKLGPESCVMVTDHGQSHNPPVVEALSDFAEAMLQNGLDSSAIKKMLVDNPRHLLGID